MDYDQVISAVEAVGRKKKTVRKKLKFSPSKSPFKCSPFKKGSPFKKKALKKTKMAENERGRTV
jgi:hypothetical protein